ncbi:MAG: FAD-dependent oxidoreductase [Spirochaetia bacterium]|jgi:NAD(P)H-nitrite reductase large subunit|nr:FAD-dependent oxidoreductase [Spirochaetia bacterium]
MRKYVIIGTGPAGTYAAQTIRENDKTGKITIISDEGREFYVREHLNKYLAGKESREDLFEKGLLFSKTIDAEFVSGCVIDIDPEQNILKMADGCIIPFDKLLIASGGKPFKLRLPGCDLKGIHTIYSLADADIIRESLKNRKNIAIIGGGSIAVKLSPVLLEMGKNVAIIERLDGIMPQVLDKDASNILKAELLNKGAEIHTGKEVTEFTGENNAVSGIILKSGEKLYCDLAVISIGIKQSIDFLKNSGIIYDKGVIVNKFMQTNYPHIFAAGDAAQTPDPLHNNIPLLHPGWGESKQQGICAGLNMSLGKTEYIGEIRLNRMSFYDISFVSGGIIEPDIDSIQIKNLDTDKANYLYFNFKKEKLIGGIILGRNFDSKLWKKWLKKELLNPGSRKITPDTAADFPFFE